jgi:hypothetical protein
MAAGSVVALSCASPGQRPPDRAAQVLSAVPPPSTRCMAERLPAELPAANVVVDSALIAGFLETLARADSAPSGYVLITLTFDEEGLSTRRAVIEHSTTALVADTIQRMMFSARRQVDPSDAEWGVRLRLDLADSFRMQVGRREFCPPVAQKRELAEAIEGFNPVGIRYRGGVRERVLHMRALVDENGTITTAHIERGDLRGSSLERNIVRHLQQYLFEPAKVDGFDTSAWITIPVRVTA